MDYWQCKIIPKNELKRWRSVDLNRVWKLLGLLWRCMAEICCKLLVALQLVFRYTLHLLPWALLLAFVKYLRGFSNCFALTARASLCFCWQQSFALVINHDEERNRRAIGVGTWWQRSVKAVALLCHATTSGQKSLFNGEFFDPQNCLMKVVLSSCENWVSTRELLIFCIHIFTCVLCSMQLCMHCVANNTMQCFKIEYPS